MFSLQIVTYITARMNCNLVFSPLKFAFLTSLLWLAMLCCSHRASGISVSWYVLIVMYVLEPLQIIYDTRR